MSQEDQDAILGRTMRELREAKERLERLRAEAARRGQKLKEAGQALAGYPEGMIQEGESADVRFRSHHTSMSWKPSDIILPDDIHKLTGDIRTEMIEIGRLNDSLANMGHK